MQTEDLIRGLAADNRPVRRLGAPMRRMVGWLVPTFETSALIVLAFGVRPDLIQKLAEPRYVIEIAAAIATGILAAFAALSSGTPGRPRWERLAPLPPLVLWLGTLGEGCWSSVLRAGPDGQHIMPDLICIPAILLVGTLPAALMFWMVRRGAPLTPSMTAALAALAASAVGAAALRLFHPQDASIMVLVWQFGTVALLTVVTGLFGRRFLRWPEVRVAVR